MNGSLLKDLKKQVSIAQVLQAYGLHDHLRRRGCSLIGPCPLHGGDNPTAFRVHLQRGQWHCFTVCGGGDTVELVRRIERCTHAEAARIMRRMITNPATSTSLQVCASDDGPAATNSFRPFRRRIPVNPNVPFLQEEKRITLQTATRFEAGLADPKSKFLQGTVAVRLHDMQGHPLGYCGRRLDPDDIRQWGKWRFPSRFPKGKILYNAHRALPTRHKGIVVVECPWAVMRITQAATPGVVALLGTAITPTQLRWLAQAPALLVLLDGDGPGRKCSKAIANALKRLTTVYIHQLPEQREPEDLTDAELLTLLGTYFPFSLNQPPSFERAKEIT